MCEFIIQKQTAIIFRICLGIVLFHEVCFSQEKSIIVFPDHLAKTSIAGLKSNDSLLYYQCHITEASTQLSTASGETITGEIKKITITDKFVVYQNNGIYSIKYYSSTLSNFPNRKFSYLKVREKEYWNFKFEKAVELNEHDVLIFAAIEKKAHAANEFELVVDKSNNNALVIRNKKTMKHLVVEGDYQIKKSLEALKENLK